MEPSNIPLYMPGFQTSNKWSDQPKLASGKGGNQRQPVIFTAELQTGSLNPLAALQSDNKITAFNRLFCCCDDYLMYFPNMPFNQLANHETDGSVLSVAISLENTS